MLDDQATWLGKGVISDGDPVITFGPKPAAGGGFTFANGARAYYASLASIPSRKGFEFVIVSHSDDNGATWSAPVIGTTKTGPVDFNDKNWISVDSSPSSPFFGRSYLSWTEFRSNTVTGNGSEPMMVALSTDGGASFAAPNQLTPAGNNRTGNGRQGSSIDIGPDGTVYIGFEQGPAQVVVVSRDGGKSWTRPITVAPVVDLDAAIPGSNFRTDSFPTIAADPRSGSTTLYARLGDQDCGRRARSSSPPPRIAVPIGAHPYRSVVPRVTPSSRDWMSHRTAESTSVTKPSSPMTLRSSAPGTRASMPTRPTSLLGEAGRLP